MFTFLRTSAVVIAALVAVLRNEAIALAQQDEEATPDSMIVQARGPVHEAFAKPFQKDAGPTPVIPKKPPAPIPEEPPEQKPAGNNVQWIPGYWAWDDEKKDFLWVSGVWRDAPPKRRWAPGHWSDAQGGWQWVPGLWAEAAHQNLQYLPEPPASVDNGPPAPAPDTNSFYIPGCWKCYDTGYVWRPGFWSPYYSNWVWNPSCYSWTPGGYLFNSGYWDYPFANRGLLFAPVWFHRPLFLNPGFFFRPRFFVPFNGLSSNLFVGPGFHHFFFGDFFDPRFSRLGFHPWFASGSHFHDPLFSHALWTHRGDPNWMAGLHSTFAGRMNGSLPRPPHTLAQQNALLQASHSVRSGNPNAGVNNHVLTPLNQVHRSQTQVTTLSAAQLATHRTATQQLRAASLQRNQVERPGAGLTAGRPSGMANVAERRSFFAGPGGNSRAGFQAPSNGTSLRAGGGPAGLAHNSATFGNLSAGHTTMPHFQAPSTRSFSMPQGGPTFSRTAPTFHGGSPARGGSSFRGGSSGGHVGGGHSGGGHGSGSGQHR